MASAKACKNVVLTGPPGVGKTTLIKKVCEALKESRVAIQGFYTEELREANRRVGFDVVTLNGNRGPLARIRDESRASIGQNYKVGQYSVELNAFERTALPVLALKHSDDCPVYVIDEIGKMEMFSARFKQDVQKLFDAPHNTVVATIPIRKGKPIPLVEDIRFREDVQLFAISRENRDEILTAITEAVLKSHTKVNT